MIRYLALALLLLCAAPAQADEGYTITPIGERWYMIIVSDLVPVPAGGRVRVTVWLDDIPGGVDSAPYLYALPKVAAHSLEFSVTNASFAPLTYSTYPVPFVSAIIHNASAADEEYRVKVHVRGRE